jgi:hypothetical protein
MHDGLGDSYLLICAFCYVIAERLASAAGGLFL